MGVACSSRSVRVSHVLSSSPACREEVSSSPDEEVEEEDEEEEDNGERSVKTAVVLISEQVEETLELMLDGTSLSCEEATPPLLLLYMSSEKKDGDNAGAKSPHGGLQAQQKDDLIPSQHPRLDPSCLGVHDEVSPRPYLMIVAAAAPSCQERRERSD